MSRNTARCLFLVPPLLLIAATSFAQDASGGSTETATLGQPNSRVEGSPPSAFGRKGFYVGLGMGAAFDPGVSDWQSHGFTTLQNIAQEIHRNSSQEAFTTGIIAGYQVPISQLVPSWTVPIVIGPEIDFNYVGNLRKNDTASYVHPPGGLAPAGTYTFSTNRDSNYYGTVRSHIGYVFANSRAQAYISAGFAYAGNSGGGRDLVYTSPAGASTLFSRGGSNASHTGGAYGLGGEYALDNNMVLRVEYIYVDLKSNSHSFTGPGGTPYFISNDVKGHFSVARAAFFWHF